MGSQQRAAMEQLHVRRLNIQSVAGDIFQFVESSSDASVLWGELFKENERQLLRHEMISHILRLLLRESYQIVAKSLWRPEVRRFRGPGLRKGKCALLLHSTERRQSSGWAWAKLMRPLYMRGFSVVTLDLPGFGGSMINNRSDVEVGRWRRQAGDLIVECVTELYVDKVHIVAHGDACEFAMKIIDDKPNRTGTHHVFHNPTLDLDRLVPLSSLGLTKTPGMPYDEWKREVRQGQLSYLERAIRSSEVVLFATFDESASPASLEAMRTLEDIRAMTVRMARRITIEQVTRNEICEASAGVDSPARIFVLSRWLRERYTDFVSGAQQGSSDDVNVWASMSSEASLPPRRRPMTGSSSYFPGATAPSGWAPSEPGAWPQGEVMLRSSAPSPPPAAISPSPTKYGVPSQQQSLQLQVPQQPQQQLSLQQQQQELQLQQQQQQQAGQLALPGPNALATADGQELALWTPQQAQLAQASAAAGGATSSALALAQSRAQTKALAAPAVSVAGIATSSTAAAALPERYTIKQLAVSQRSLSAPQIYRQKLIQRPPKEMRPIDLDRLRAPPEPEPGLRQEEINQLEDGIDASLGLWVENRQQELQRLTGDPTAGLRDFRTRTPESRRAAWKGFNKTMRANTTLLSRKQSRVF